MQAQPKISFQKSSLNLTSSMDLQPNRCIPTRHPNTMAFEGTDAMDRNGGAGLNTPVAASVNNHEMIL
jgi:hypothetical protein